MHERNVLGVEHLMLLGSVEDGSLSNNALHVIVTFVTMRHLFWQC